MINAKETHHFAFVTVVARNWIHPHRLKKMFQQLYTIFSLYYASFYKIESLSCLNCISFVKKLEIMSIKTCIATDALSGLPEISP